MKFSIGPRIGQGALLASLTLLLQVQPALASRSAKQDVAKPASDDGSTVRSEEASDAALSIRSAPSIRIERTPGLGSVTVSKAGDALGRPVYPARSSFSGTSVVVALSYRRPVTRSSISVGTGGSLSLPSSLPVAARALTSGFGTRRHPVLGTIRRHNGVDLAAPHGSPVVATSDGVVSKADWHGGYGLYVSLEHPGGLQTRYGHMSRLNVVAGQRVGKGDVIGYVGSTGLSTGPHLHYEMRKNGEAVKPAF